MSEKQADPSPLGPRGVAAETRERGTLRAQRGAAAAAEEKGRIELLGERLRAEAVQEQPELVRVYTELVERTEQITVTLHEERLIIETEAGRGRVTLNGEAVERGERIEILLSREQAVVSTEVVPLEDVRIRTERLQRGEKITGTVRHEELMVEGPHGRVQPAKDGVTIISA